MSVGDLRRNIRLGLHETEPKHFNPPDPNNASSIEQDYDYILQFAFLIDRNGQIHVTVGSREQLSIIIGHPVMM